MSSPQISVASRFQDRALFFALPGVAQGVVAWELAERMGESDGPYRYGLAALCFVLLAPTIFFLTTTARRRVGPAIFSVVLAASIAGFALFCQQIAPDRGVREADIDGIAASASIAAAILIPFIVMPFYRAAAERGERYDHYPSLFDFAWGLPVVLLLSNLFVGAVWAMLALLAGLFHLIGIDWVWRFLTGDTIVAAITTGVFALGIANVREREGAVLVLRGIVLSSVKAVAPVFAVATVIFAGAALVQGLDFILVDLSPVVLIGTVMVVGIVLFCGVIGPEGPIQHRILSLSAFALAGGLVACAGLCIYAIGIRVAAEGLTSARIAVVTGVFLLTAYALSYGAAAALGGRWQLARQANVAMAFATLGLLLYFQTPAFRPLQWSANSQAHKALEEETINDSRLVYLAFDSGKPGREALARLATQPAFADDENQARINRALNASSRWELRRSAVEEEVQPAFAEGRVGEWLTVRPAGTELEDPLKAYLAESYRRDIEIDGVLTGEMVVMLVPDRPRQAWVATRDRRQVRFVAVNWSTGYARAMHTVYLTPRAREDAEAIALMEKIRTEPFGPVPVTIEMPMVGGQIINPIRPQAQEAFPRVSEDPTLP